MFFTFFLIQSFKKQTNYEAFAICARPGHRGQRVGMWRRKIRWEGRNKPQEETMLRRKLAQAAEEKGAKSAAWRQQQQQQRRRLPQVVPPCVLLSQQESCLSDPAPQGCQGRLMCIHNVAFNRLGFYCLSASGDAFIALVYCHSASYCRQLNWLELSGEIAPGLMIVLVGKFDFNIPTGSFASGDQWQVMLLYVGAFF